MIILALLFACLSNSLAQREAMIDKFLSPIITASAADPNVEAWSWKMNRNGGYILRRTMDVTGDGQTEIFIASTLHSNRRGHYWKVFDLAKDGDMRQYEQGLDFGSAWPVTENGKTYLMQHPFPARPGDESFRAGDGNLYRVIRHSFAFPDVRETTTYVSEAEAMKLRPTDPSELPKMQAILLADYLTNPDAEWSEVTELKLDGSDSYYIEENEERAEKNTAFTPQAALERLGLGQSTPKDQKGVNQSEQAAAPSVQHEAAPTKANHSHPIGSR